jgi:hypothetical protein
MYSVHVLCVVKVSKGLITGDQPLPYRSIERPRTRTRTRISHKRRNDAPAPFVALAALTARIVPLSA